jgi:hypothetical protein
VAAQTVRKLDGSRVPKTTRNTQVKVKVLKELLPSKGLSGRIKNYHNKTTTQKA